MGGPLAQGMELALGQGTGRALAQRMGRLGSARRGSLTRSYVRRVEIHFYMFAPASRQAISTPPLYAHNTVSDLALMHTQTAATPKQSAARQLARSLPVGYATPRTSCAHPLETFAAHRRWLRQLCSGRTRPFAWAVCRCAAPLPW